MSDDLEQIKVQLDEKEQLVEALTLRLEQAAEQLDRIRRTGSNRNLKIPGGSGGASLSPEFLEQQNQIATDVQNISKQWTETQGTGSLANIEHQIGDVRDLIIDLCQKQQNYFENSSISGTGIPAAENVTSFLSQLEETPDIDESNVEEQAVLPEETTELPDSSFDFNALKKSLLSDEAEESIPSDQPPVINSLESSIVTGETDQVEDSGNDVDPPAEITFEGASLEQLHEAIETRDAYISYLLRKFRASQSRHISLPNWDTLEGIPEELLKESHKLSEKLTEQLRLSEVDHALERARLGREASRLKILQTKLDKEQQNISDDQTEKEDPDSEQTSSRWMRMLSSNRKQKSDE